MRDGGPGEPDQPRRKRTLTRKTSILRPDTCSGKRHQQARRFTCAALLRMGALTSEHSPGSSCSREALRVLGNMFAVARHHGIG